MKKIKIILLSLFVIFGFSSVFATVSTTSVSSWYNTPIITNDFQFEAKLYDDWSVKTYWKAYNKDEKLKYYKLVRSSNNSNPVYPDDWYIKYSSDINFTNYFDYKALAGISYYRVCAITYENNRYCSWVVKINKENIVWADRDEHWCIPSAWYTWCEVKNKCLRTWEEKCEIVTPIICTMEYVPVCWEINWVKKTYWNKCMLNWANAKYLYSWECQTSNLNYALKLKVVKIAKDFIDKIENKYSSTEKRIEILKNIIIRFEKLSEENSKYLNLVNYFNEIFKAKIDLYDNGLSEIEDILNDY